MIGICMRDPGGTAAVVPIVRELLGRAVSVSLYAEGVGAKILANEERLAFVSDFDAFWAGRPSFIVSSICTKGGKVPIELTEHAQKNGVPVAWVQDLWGNHVKPYWSNTVRPDYVFTLDEVGVQKIRESWPDYDPARIFAYGQPKFDVIAAMRLDPVLQAVKDSLHEREVRIITVAGQIAGMKEAMDDFLFALGTVGFPVLVDFMHHGRCPAEKLLEFRDLYPDFEGGLATELGKLDRNQRLLFGDVLFTMFSTDAVAASVLGKHVISYLAPPGRASFEAEGYSGQFALTEAGACLSASNYEELYEALEKILTQPDQRHHRQLATDGQSAQRIAGKLVELAGMRTNPAVQAI